jgi:hypothetical protein
MESKGLLLFLQLPKTKKRNKKMAEFRIGMNCFC